MSWEREYIAEHFPVALKYMKREDARFLGTLSPHIDRIVRLVPHLTSEEVRQLTRHALPRKDAFFRAAVACLKDYVAKNEYRCEVGQTYMERLLYNENAPAPSAEAAAYVCAALVEVNESVLLERQLRFISDCMDSHALLNVLRQQTDTMPMFDQMLKTTAWCNSVAGVLVMHALTNAAFECITTLLANRIFVSVLPVAAVDEIQRLCANSLIAMHTTSRTKPESTALYITSKQAARLRNFATQKMHVLSNTDLMLEMLTLNNSIWRVRNRLRAPDEIEEPFVDMQVQKMLARVDLAQERRAAILEAIAVLRQKIGAARYNRDAKDKKEGDPEARLLDVTAPEELDKLTVTEQNTLATDHAMLHTLYQYFRANIVRELHECRVAHQQARIKAAEEEAEAQKAEFEAVRERIQMCNASSFYGEDSDDDDDE